MAGSGGEVIQVLSANRGEMIAERRNEAGGEDGPTIFAALTVPHQDLIPLYLYVLDSEVECFEKAETPSVEEAAHDAMWPGQLVDQRATLAPRQHDGNTLRTFGVDHVAQPRELAPEDLRVQEQDRGQGLVLTGGAHPIGIGEARQERGDLGLGQRIRVPFAMEQDEAPDPADIGLLCSCAGRSDGRGLVERRRRDRRDSRAP